MRAWHVTLLAAASGCAQIFGIDVTSGPDAASGDRVSVQIQRLSIGATVIKGPQDLSGEMAHFLVDDGADGFMQVPGERTAPDTFTIALPTGMPAVVFTLPDSMIVERYMLALPSRTQKASYVVFEHPSPQPPLPSSEIALDVTLPSAYVSGQTFRIEAIGAWMQRVVTELPAPDVGNTTIAATLPYASFTPMMSSPAARITSADVVVLLRYTSGNILTGVLQAQFDQTDGIDRVTGAMTSVAADRTLMATVDPNGYQTRYAAVRPAVSGLGMGWQLRAAPGWSVGQTAGPGLHAGGVAMTDTTITASYGNPFESLDWRTLFVFSTSSVRTFTLNAVPVPLGASMATTTQPGTSSVALDLPAGLPLLVRANMVPLTTDGMNLPLDLTKPVTIDATLDRPTNTSYTMAITELDVSSMTAMTKVVLGARSTTPSFRVPPDVFQVGRTYFVTFRSFQGGYTAAAMGDVQSLSLPFSTAALDSGAFTVVAP